MATTFTYDDFLRKLQSSGMSGNFSDADLALAKKNPDAGMTILSAKQDYAGATTPELRALANERAEAVRRQYGNYTAGTDGSQFYSEGLAPSSFSPSYSAPTYENRYDSDISDLWAKLKDRQDFSWDAATDPSYQAYAKEYAREGQRATADTMAQIAAQNGGQVSSYAATAGAQAGNYYAAQMADKVPELYDAAYQRYLNDFTMDRQKLSDALTLENSDYGKYLDSLSQWNTDRSFEYGQLLDEISNQRQNRSTALSEALVALEHGDTSKMEALGFDMSNDTSIDRARAELEALLLQNETTRNADNRAEREMLLTEALTALAHGDVSKMEALGYDMSNDTSVAAAQAELESLRLQNELARNADSRAERELQLSERADSRAERQLQDTLLNNALSRELSSLSATSSAASSNASSTSLTSSQGKAMYDKYLKRLEDAGVDSDIVDDFMDYDTWTALKVSGLGGSFTAVDTYGDYVETFFKSATEP